MKILLINKFYHSRGGADRHFLDLEKLLKETGHQVAVFSMHHPENLATYWEKYFLSQVDLNAKQSLFQNIKLAGRMIWSLEARIKIAKLLDEFNPDIVHLHNIYHQISPSILGVIKKRDIPIVMTVHDWKLISPNYLLNCQGGFCQKCSKGKWAHVIWGKKIKNSYLKSLLAYLEFRFHLMIKVYRKNIDLFIAPSNFVKSILVNAGYCPEKIVVLHHFVGQFESKDHQNMDLQSKKEDNFVPDAIYFGRIARDKGVLKIIRAFSKLGIKLALAGRKENGIEINENHNVKYLGPLKSEELKYWIKKSKFVVSPSELPETFGFIAAEALVLGKLFLGFWTGAYPEIIENGKNGYLVNNWEEFKLRALDLKRNWKKPIAAGENFSRQAYLKSLEVIYNNLVQSDEKQLSCVDNLAII